MKRRSIRTAAAITLTALVGAGEGVTAFALAGAGESTSPTRTALAGTPAAATEQGSTVNDVFESASASVVEISTSAATQGGPFGFDQPQSGVGSGFVYDEAGHIVTNYHVVEGAETVTVTFSDGTEREATVVGTDPSTDLAVIKVDAPAGALEPLALADSGSLEVGDLVVAIGSPYGLEGTVTAGIVSALGRQIQAPNGATISGAIQTDAAINQGNSGGPLLDAAGRVVGVNAQIESGNGGNVGLGFAVPGSTVRSVASQLVKGEQVEHAYLGVQIETVPANVAEELGGPERSAVAITEVTPGSPAAKAGLRAGDGAARTLVTAVDGKPVESAADLQAAIAAKESGDEVELTVVRDGSERSLSVMLGSRPS